MATIDKIRLSGQTYDIIDATAVHSLDGYATTGYVQSATSALAESFEEVISGKADSSAVTLEISAAVSGKADTSAVTEAIDAAVSGKADASDVETLSGTVTGHTADTTIHVTSSDKETWNAKADISDIPSVSGYADAVAYDSGTTTMNFYHGGTGGTVVYSFDASPFIIDGMTDDVRIETLSGTSYLVIDFNTASGKQDIYIPLTDIFDPSNYYTKSEIDASLSGKADFSAATITTQESGTVTNTRYSGFFYLSFNYDDGVYSFSGHSAQWGGYMMEDGFSITISDGTNTTYLNRSNTGDTSNYTFTTTLHDFVIETKGSYKVTSVIIQFDSTSRSVDYTYMYSKSSETAVSTAIENNIYPRLDAIESGKTDTSAFTAHTADTTIHVTSSDKETWNGKQNALTPGDGIQISGDVISVTGAPLTVDQTVISGSTNPVAGGAVYDELQGKQATLVSGTNIKTVGTESILGSGNIKLMTASIGTGNDSTTLIFDFN